MPQHQTFRPPIPVFVPTLTVALVLLVLYWFGVQEQQRLAQDRIEQVVQQRQTIARIVAQGIEQDLQNTEASVLRFAQVLASQIDLPMANAATRFDALIEPLPDGSMRSRRDSFDPDTQAGIWIPDYLKPDAATKQFFIRARQLTELYGRGAQGQVFVDTWLLPRISGITIFWPDEADFIYQIAGNFDYRDTAWVQLTRPETNPSRKAQWTRMTFDTVPQVWMMSAVAPFYWRNEWYGAVGHDLPLDNLLARTSLLRQQEGSHFVLVAEDDTVLASDLYADAIKHSHGTLTTGQLGDAELQGAIDSARSNASTAQHQRFSLENRIVFVSRILPQNWLLVNAIELEPISSAITASFLRLRNIMVTALIVELIIATLVLAWSHQRSRRQFELQAAVQAQLQTSETHYRNLVDNIPGVVYRCICDQHWTMTFISPTVLELAGYPASDFTGNSVRSYASIIHPDDRARGNRTIEEAATDRSPFALEYRIVRADGSTRWVLEQGRWVDLPDGDQPQLEGVILDITPLKVAEEKLRELNTTLEAQVEQRTGELREAIQDLETFNYAVSHDLRAPVRQVSGYLEALQDELAGQASQDVKHIIERSQMALGRMREMIAGLHAFSQLGRDALTAVRININDMIRNVIDSLPESARQRTRFDVVDLNDVTADRILLRIVLYNLIDNAVKYSSRNPHPMVTIRDHSTLQEWIIEVHDNGAGFNPQYADRLFQIFQRLHSADLYPGFGIGLALCNKIITLHGGRIWAESEVNQGARFFVALPLQPVARHGEKISVSL